MTPPPTRGGDRCGCGRFYADHSYLDCGSTTRNQPARHLTVPSGVLGIPGAPTKDREKKWSIKHHTQEFPTDAFGTIEFQGAPSPSRAQVGHGIRLFGFDLYSALLSRVCLNRKFAHVLFYWFFVL